ncbi:hypothetical protein ACHAXS_000126 [Conticribra weissflogii]
MDAALHIMAYLVYTTTHACVRIQPIQTLTMSSFQLWIGNNSNPLGKPVDTHIIIDSDHAGDNQTRRSSSGFLIYVNTALVDWYSKQQATFETGVIGAEFVAMKMGVDVLRGLRYKLRMRATYPSLRIPLSQSPSKTRKVMQFVIKL